MDPGVAMKTIPFPDPITLPGAPPYTIHRFLEEHVWTHQSWREDEAGWAALERAAKAFAEHADHADVEDGDHARIWRIVLGAQIAGAYVSLLIPIFRAIGSAATKKEGT
jgi:hypothetical protein